MGTRLAVSGYIGLAVYCLLSLCLGPMGLTAYSRLDARVRSMQENLASLEALNAEARARRDSALSDPESLALEARSLGYVEPGQIVVRMGFPEASPVSRDLGTLIPYIPPEGMDDAALKTIALAAGLLAAFASLLLRAPGEKKAPRRRRSDGAASPLTKPGAA